MSKATCFGGHSPPVALAAKNIECHMLEAQSYPNVI